MKLFTSEQHKKLLANGVKNWKRRNEGKAELDLKPVVKLFTPDGSATWLLTGILPEEPNMAFGLCDLGMGCPELGYICLAELSEARGRLGLPVERDLYFEADKKLSAYAKDADQKGAIVA